MNESLWWHFDVFLLTGRPRRGRSPGQTRDAGGKSSPCHLWWPSCDLWLTLLPVFFIGVEWHLSICFTRMYRKLWPTLVSRWVGLICSVVLDSPQYLSIYLSTRTLFFLHTGTFFFLLFQNSASQHISKVNKKINIMVPEPGTFQQSPLLLVNTLPQDFP